MCQTNINTIGLTHGEYKMSIKIKLAKGTDHEFEIELPFKTKKELKRARLEWRLNNYPNRRKTSLILEFYLQFLPEGTSISFIAPNKAYNLNFYKRKYGDEEGVKKYNEKIKNDTYKNTLNGFIDRYGNEIGTIKYYEKNKKLSVSTESLKLNGHTEEEIIKIKDKHRGDSKNTIDNFIKRHGEVEGNKKWNIYINENHHTPSMLSYWIRKGYSEDRAKKIISDLQRRGLPYFIKKYGDVDGKQRFMDANCKKVKNASGISFLEKQVYCDLLNHYNCYNCYPIDNYVVDIFIPEKNTIIEIQGDYFHCNPTIWNKNDYNKTIRMFAKDIWEKDEARGNKLKNLGYVVIYIWESDIRIGKKFKPDYLNFILNKIKENT